VKTAFYAVDHASLLAKYADSGYYSVGFTAWTCWFDTTLSVLQNIVVSWCILFWEWNASTEAKIWLFEEKSYSALELRISYFRFLSIQKTAFCDWQGRKELLCRFNTYCQS